MASSSARQREPPVGESADECMVRKVAKLAADRASFYTVTMQLFVAG